MTRRDALYVCVVEMGVREHDLYKFLVVYIRVSAKENKNKERNDKKYSYDTNGNVRNLKTHIDRLSKSSRMTSFVSPKIENSFYT
ncbi:hypothetical protein V1478_009310 [Vespula squamosa]|uniref:Uncharacterized protein n=1 Tax=Vespula squamosa TaxID=30214 RepID=A0ABD2AP94_VESSQ